MKYVKVSNTVAIVDDQDYDLVVQYRWWLTKQGYAYTQKSLGGVRTTTLMHRLITEPGGAEEVDHKNLDKLDNRRRNLRLCTRSQNNANRASSKAYKGVRWSKNAWQAEIKKDRKYVYIGRFKTAELAARKYDEKAFELFGEFAYTNFPKEEYED